MKGVYKTMPETEAQKKAHAKYQSKTYDKVLLRLRKDTEPTRETITSKAAAHGMSVNAYIVEAITEKIQRDK